MIAAGTKKQCYQGLFNWMYFTQKNFLKRLLILKWFWLVSSANKNIYLFNISINKKYIGTKTIASNITEMGKNLKQRLYIDRFVFVNTYFT